MKYKIQNKSRRRRKYNQRLRRKFRKPIPRTVVPSFFTLMNLVCGVLATVQILEGNLVNGAWLIVFAGFFDALDGFMARLASATSEFGIELDSLGDMVSFGVAPALLMYAFSLQEMQIIGLIVCVLPAICGSVRLARFNVNARLTESIYFNGLPIPAQAIMLVAFYLTFREQVELFAGFEYGVNNIVIPMVILLSFLMVTTVPFDKIPKFTRSYIRKHRWRVLLFLFYFALIIVFQEYGLMVAFSLFILKGLSMSAVNFWQDLNGDDEDEDEDDRIMILEDLPPDDRY